MTGYSLQYFFLAEEGQIGKVLDVVRGEDAVPRSHDADLRELVDNLTQLT